MRRENVGFAAFDIVMSNGWLMLTEVTSMNLNVIVCNRNSCTLCSVIALIEGGCEVDICNATTHVWILCCIWSVFVFVCHIYIVWYIVNIIHLIHGTHYIHDVYTVHVEEGDLGATLSSVTIKISSCATNYLTTLPFLFGIITIMFAVKDLFPVIVSSVLIFAMLGSAFEARNPFSP